MLKPLVAVALLGASVARADVPTIVEPAEAKVSLATEPDDAAWRHTGFRLALGVQYGELHGLRGAPSGRLLGVDVRVGLRLDADWSLYATFVYASASRSGGLSGLRFAGTLDPTWHVTPHVALSAGLGFGGIVEGSTGRPDVDPLGSTLNTSYTFPGASPPLPSCSGVGLAALARASYAKILSARTATMVELEVIGQETACTQSTGLLEVDTATPIVRRQYWPHAGVTLLWGVTWR